MGNHISANCRKKLKAIEDKLLWSIKSIRDGHSSDIILDGLVSFTSNIEHFSGQPLDDRCKKLLFDYEKRIINLHSMTTPQILSGLDDMLSSINSHLDI